MSVVINIHRTCSYRLAGEYTCFDLLAYWWAESHPALFRSRLHACLFSVLSMARSPDSLFMLFLKYVLISFSFEKDLSAFAKVTGRVRNSLTAVATSATLGNMERCFMNRVCAKSWTEPSSIYFMVDTNALLNERTCSGKFADKSSLYWSAEALVDENSSPSDFNRSSCGHKNPNIRAPLACP